MGTIIRRPGFIEDLEKIWGYIALDSPTNADRFLRELESKYRVLSDAPFIGVTKLPDFPDIRFFTFKKYLIVYQPLRGEEGIELIRVFQGTQKWQDWIEEEI